MKIIKYNKDARNALMAGATKVHNATKVTMGAKGRNVLLERHGVPDITKDGVSVAREVFLDDPFENKGAQLFVEVAENTNKEVGDATTTSIVLAHAITKGGLKVLSKRVNPNSVKSGIEKAVAEINKLIVMRSQPINTLQESIQVATVSANGDRALGEEVAKAIHKVGKDGVVSIQPSDTLGLSTTHKEGMQFDRGYASPYFCKSVKETARTMDNPLILITNTKVHTIADIQKIFDKVSAAKRELLIIAKEFGDNALKGLIKSSLQGAPVCAVLAPYTGDIQLAMLEDIAILTNGRVIDSEYKDLDSVELEDLGEAKVVEVNDKTTAIIDGAGTKEDIEDRIELIKAIQEEEARDQESMHLKIRLAKLTSGVSVIKIGGATEVERGERIDRAVDAQSATRAGLEEGIVPGGGVLLTQIAKELEKVDLSGCSRDEKAGFCVVKRAIEQPLRQIVINAGLNGKKIAKSVKFGKSGYGFDARTNKIVHMIDSGIIDPAKVTRVALKNASSIACMLLTTECAIVEG